MDPVSLQASGLNAIRPTIALQADLSAVLREGRVLAGEVLQSFGGGSVLIGVGSHRIPARSQVELHQGHRFLFVVEGEGAELSLRVLEEGAAREPDLLRALRSVLGQDRPLGALLDSLRASLVELGGDPALLAKLEAQLLGAEATGSSLAARLASGGLAFEGRLAIPAALALPPAEAAVLAADLAAWLATGLVHDLPPAARELGTREGLLARLGAELARILGAGADMPSREAAFARWLGALLSPGSGSVAPDLGQLLSQALQALTDGSVRERLLANLGRARVGGLGPGLEVLVLRRLLGVGNARAGQRSKLFEAFAALAGEDLKGRLLAALERAPQGAVREAFERALSGIEAEQLLNVARRDGGEAVHWSVPIADGGSWETAHLFVDSRAGRDSEGSPDPAWRLTLALELSGTGPLRAELLARPGSLVVAVQVARPEALEVLSGGLRELEQRLATGARSVQVSLRLSPAESLSVEATAADVRYLREHHLMDLSA